MKPVQKWYLNKGLWAGVVGLVAGVLGLYGLTMDPVDQAALVNGVMQLISVFGGE